LEKKGFTLLKGWVKEVYIIKERRVEEERWKIVRTFWKPLF